MERGKHASKAVQGDIGRFFSVVTTDLSSTPGSNKDDLLEVLLVLGVVHLFTLICAPVSGFLASAFKGDQDNTPDSQGYHPRSQSIRDHLISSKILSIRKARTITSVNLVEANSYSVHGSFDLYQFTLWDRASRIGRIWSLELLCAASPNISCHDNDAIFDGHFSYHVAI